MIRFLLACSLRWEVAAPEHSTGSCDMEKLLGGCILHLSQPFCSYVYLLHALLSVKNRTAESTTCFEKVEMPMSTLIPWLSHSMSLLAITRRHKAS
jgi:hypothetical protein